MDYTYPGNFKTSHEYDANGTLVKIKNNNTVLWELTAMHAPGQPEAYKNSAGVSTQIGYDNTLNLQQIDLGTTSTQNFSIKNSTGNLLNRRHQNFAAGTDNREGFEYDGFNRLKKTNYLDAQDNTTAPKHNYSYEPNGNLAHKDDCGDYVYGLSNKPYQLTNVVNGVNNFSPNTLNVSYNDLDKVSQILESVSNKQYDLVYGNNSQRIKMEYRLNSQLQYTRYYQDNFDRQETANAYQEWSYVYAPTGLAAVYHNNNGVAQLYNVTEDHLGSPLLLTNSAGQVVEEYSFDAWGRRRNPVDWSYNSVPVPTKMIRGYTGHEHLEELDLINMNGRVYYPLLGRFVQPDPLVQDPGNLQNLNRYSYVLNNPLTYNDPSGYRANRPLGGSGQVDNPDPTQNLGTGPNKPALYVDGWRVTAGFEFWTGGACGGMGIATTQNFGVWTGNGPGLKNYTISRGAWLDAVNANPGSVSGMTGSGAYVQMRMVGETAKGNLVFVNPVNGEARVKPVDGSAYIQWVEFESGGGSRNYGGDGSGSFMDNTMKVLDGINQFNPVANLMDLVSNGFTGRDRLGNKMSHGEAWLKAAGIMPIGKFGNNGIVLYESLASKFGTNYISISAVQGKYMPIQLGQKLNNISPGVWSKVYEQGMLNGSKVETHYFYNSTTGQYVNPYIHHSGW